MLALVSEFVTLVTELLYLCIFTLTLIYCPMLLLFFFSLPSLVIRVHSRCHNLPNVCTARLLRNGVNARCSATTRRSFHRLRAAKQKLLR